jgi:thiol-disulfide isomerase/thioredoxin
MKRLTLALALAGLLASPAWAQDQDSAKPAADQPAQSTAEQLKQNPNDMALLRKYMTENLTTLLPLISSDPDAAEKRIDEMLALLETIEPDQEASKNLLQSAKNFIAQQKQRVAVQRTTVAELQTKLNENPDDTTTLSTYLTKVSMEVSPLVRSDPEKAEAKIKEARTFLDSIKEKAQQENTKSTIDTLANRYFSQLQQAIDSAKKLSTLVGTAAKSLDDQVTAWVNGEAVTDGDLKGKVVLLDFWAVWCGPCIATFPHLREWNEQYADKGLVIIGLTNYYNYKWDEDAQRATRSQEPVAPEAEHEMLAKFCEQHQLHHRIAVQNEKSKLAEHYAVTGIPHVVVIDREGKVRMIRVGSGEENAKAIGDLLAQLVGA